MIRQTRLNLTLVLGFDHFLCPSSASVFALTHFCLVWLPILWQLDELLGEHVAAVAQDVALQLHVGTWPQELHDDGVAGGVDANLHVLPAHCMTRTEGYGS